MTEENVCKACDVIIYWGEIFPNFTTWFLIILGWYIIHRLALSREKIKFSLGYIAETKKMLKKLETDAIKYHTSQSRGVHLERDINSAIDMLDRRLQFLIKSENVIISLRQSITLNNFQTSNFLKHEYESGLIKEISRNFLDIHNKLFDLEIEKLK